MSYQTKLLNDHEIENPIPATIGIGLRFKDDKGYTMESVCNESPRKVRPVISTYTGGFDSSAMHWYGRLETSSLSFKVAKIPKCSDGEYKIGQHLWIGGFYDTFKPEDMAPITIQITRPVTEKDKKIDEGQRFYAYNVGDMTNCLDTLEDVKVRLVETFNRVFGNGWVLDETGLKEWDRL